MVHSLDRPARTEADAADRRTGSYLTELRDGWDFLRGDPVLVAMSAMLAVTNLLDIAFVAVLLPVWAREHGYGIGVVSTYFAAWAAASTVGAVIAAWAGARLPRFTGVRDRVPDRRPAAVPDAGTWCAALAGAGHLRRSAVWRPAS